MSVDTSGILARRMIVTEREITAAFPSSDALPDQAVRLALIDQLNRYYGAYMGGPETFQNIPRLNGDFQIAEIEDAWLRWEDAQVDPVNLPVTAESFGGWFTDVATRHVQPEFCRYLAEEATLAEIALFFMAEELVDSRFDDLVAMVQIGAAAHSKLTMAENYWDEMGEGKLERMHTGLFEHSAKYMRRKLAEYSIDMAELHSAEIYENACLVLMYGIHRHLAPRALGAMGLMESSAPTRFQAMVDGCTRLQVPDDVIIYQRIHVHVDADHGSEWLTNVLIPLVRQSPALLREVSMGILTRRRVADAYYERVWRQMRALRRGSTEVRQGAAVGR